MYGKGGSTAVVKKSAKIMTKICENLREKINAFSG
jgi:hypothetical protein